MTRIPARPAHASRRRDCVPRPQVRLLAWLLVSRVLAPYHELLAEADVYSGIYTGIPHDDVGYGALPYATSRPAELEPAQLPPQSSLRNVTRTTFEPSGSMT